jgi:hypothetical protein
MSRLHLSRRPSRRLLVVVFPLVLLAPLLSLGPAAAHTFTRNDGNDSPGRLDIRSASVGHQSNRVLHTVRTYETWTPRGLGDDSFFIIGIDKNFDSDFERCAFIFFAGGRLRGSLTNCGRSYIRQLPVTKPSGAVARVSISTADTGLAYRWVAFSYWTGRPVRCSDLCFDAAPNSPPPILHDLILPIVTMTSTPLRVWESSTDANFTFPFDVSDAHTGIRTWTLQSRPVGSASWTTAAAGTGAGAKSPDIAGVEDTRTDYRVVATDMQGNKAISSSRRVYIATDDDSVDASAYESPAIVVDASAFGGSYQETDSFTYVFTPSDGCQYFELVGPGGSGDWAVQVWVDGNFFATLVDDDYVDESRQSLFSSFPCTSVTYFFDQTGGTGRFAVDAVLG